MSFHIQVKEIAIKKVCKLILDEILLHISSRLNAPPTINNNNSHIREYPLLRLYGSFIINVGIKENTTNIIYNNCFKFPIESSFIDLLKRGIKKNSPKYAVAYQ